MEDMTKNVDRKINETADRLHDGVDRVRKQGVDLMEKTFPIADEAIEKAKAKGEAVWDKAKAKGQDILSDVESAGQQTLGQVASFVRKHPAQALGYAALVGVVIGALLIPKKRD